ncbi:MAG: DUF3108 domain-containing protein [Burkholderiaceae bacterium]|jgi:hypothetical protein|nr:DUF3108 domain-containing protein [Burkholderiaceae bacterium]
MNVLTVYCAPPPEQMPIGSSERQKRAILGLAIAALAHPALLIAEPAAAATKTPRASAAGKRAAASAVRVPAAATLRYRVTGRVRGIGYKADARLEWRHQDGRYQAQWSLELPLLGTRTQRSEGRLTLDGLAPERFSERSRSERSASFDAKNQRIRFSGDQPDAVLEPGAQDRLSVTLQLAALLAAAPKRYPPGARITLQTVGVRGAERWVWEVRADETLTLAARKLPCVHLLREPREEGDIGVDLWLARTLEYLPVRLRLTQDDGDVADQQLQAFDMQSTGR